MLNKLVMAVVVFGACFVLANPADVLPQGGVVTNGNATISINGNQMTIDQLSNRAITQWQSFNISENGSVQINQPNSSSAFLARVMGSDPSMILGRVESNGHLYLAANSGIVFGANSQIDVGALVATTGGIGDADFMNGAFDLTPGGGDLIAEGTIEVAEFVKLYGDNVLVNGTITAGTEVLLRASLPFEQVGQGGISVDLSGVEPIDGGHLNVWGTITATDLIETTGGSLGFTNSATLLAQNLRLDPVNIAFNSGSGSGGISVDTESTATSPGSTGVSVSFQASNDVTFIDNVNDNAGGGLTLSAGTDIHVPTDSAVTSVGDGAGVVPPLAARPLRRASPAVKRPTVGRRQFSGAAGGGAISFDLNFD